MALIATIIDDGWKGLRRPRAIYRGGGGEEFVKEKMRVLNSDSTEGLHVY
jgi:hypothetical protein